MPCQLSSSLALGRRSRPKSPCLSFLHSNARTHIKPVCRLSTLCPVKRPRFVLLYSCKKLRCRRETARRYMWRGKLYPRVTRHIRSDRVWYYRGVRLTLSLPIPLRLYTLPYWSNPPSLIFDIRALWRSGQSARAPECQQLKMLG